MPQVVVESKSRSLEISLQGQVVIDSLKAFNDQAIEPLSPLYGQAATATIWVADFKSESALKKAVAAVVDGDDNLPFTLKLKTDGLGSLVVDALMIDMYEEIIPSALALLIINNGDR